MSIAAISASARKSGNGGNGGKSSGRTNLIVVASGSRSSSSVIGVAFGSNAAREAVPDCDDAGARRHARARVGARAGAEPETENMRDHAFVRRCARVGRRRVNGVRLELR
jgi:hypothetical protein